MKRRPTERRQLAMALDDMLDRWIGYDLQHRCRAEPDLAQLAAEGGEIA